MISVTEETYIEALVNRHINLEEIRIGVAKFYFTIVTALVAVSIVSESSQPSLLTSLLDYGIFFLFFLGILVLRFDLGIRALAARVTLSIRSIVYKPIKFEVRDKTPLKHLFDEDLIFSLIVMLINSGLILPMFAILSRKGLNVVPTISGFTLLASLLVLFLQLLYYIKMLPKLTKRIDGWPCDALIVPISSNLSKDNINHPSFEE